MITPIKREDEIIHAGISFSAEINGILNIMKDQGRILDYREDKGALESVFHVEGADPVAMTTFGYWDQIMMGTKQ